MLGCQDFCGYYDWTFAYMRRRFGAGALAELWAVAIGADSQKHYADAGARDGLRGLYNTWVKTGEDEHCDWTFTLDESRNILRWDMRQCPSKGFLLQNDLYNDEDYCDHCMGWMVPLLDKIGVEVAAHEHNHCGQCWGEMRLKNRPSESLTVSGDIRSDPRWRRGYVDRFNENVKLPMAGAIAIDPCQVLLDWFTTSCEHWVLMTDRTYVSSGQTSRRGPEGVLIYQSSEVLPKLAERFKASPPSRRPLLMHTFLPGSPPLDFVAAGLPRPVPVLPLLLRTGVYVHRPFHAPPTADEFLAMFRDALQTYALTAESRQGDQSQ
jgi:hypothetical protein